MEGFFLLMLFILIPVIPITLAWYREVKNKSRIRWTETLWIPLTLETMSFLWLLAALWLGADFSTDRGIEVWLNVLIIVVSSGFSAFAANPNKCLVTGAAACIVMAWIGVLIFQSSV